MKSLIILTLAIFSAPSFARSSQSGFDRAADEYARLSQQQSDAALMKRIAKQVRAQQCNVAGLQVYPAPNSYDTYMAETPDCVCFVEATYTHCQRK